MKASEYLSKHGGNDVSILLNSMEMIVDIPKCDIWKWFMIQKTSKAFGKAVWQMYKKSKYEQTKAV